MADQTGAFLPRWKKRAAHLFAEKEIFFRTHGRIHFLRISSRLQLGTAIALATLVAGWAVAVGGMAWHQASLASDQASMDARARSVAAQARQVNAYKASVNEIADDLRRRQDMLDDMVRSQFAPANDTPAVTGPAPAQNDAAKATAPATKQGRTGKTQTSQQSAAPAKPHPTGLAALRQTEERQTRFARHLTTLVNQRAQQAEAAIRSFGLNPRQLAARSTGSAQGGPFIPWRQDAPLTDLASALSRLNALERGLVAIPSGRPTASPMLTSSYGYRRDPFNGTAAFHAGVDFPGAYAQPILAAAEGRVSYVGQRQGYGNVVEISHGHGIMTRYAHLSGFSARIGQAVAKGTPIGRMGSTGRSTGTHLHFEVRLNDAPINPRRFLEVKEDVLKAQQSATERFIAVATHDGAEARRRG